uniref:J domain-containing protein n=1 Tax=Ditylenchus dipsaci TaxID=166011 RepID=A0A915EJ65_9BILA
MDGGFWMEQRKKRESVNTHEGVLEMVRSNKIDLSTVKLFVMDEPSSMLEKRSRQIIEFAEIKSSLPKSVQVLVFHSSLSEVVLKACSKFVPSAEFFDCGKDKRVIQGINQFYVGIKEEVNPESEAIGVGKGKDAAIIERIFKCKSYYDIFNVSKLAKASKINEKYRALSRKFHPDKCAETHSTEVFKLINHAKNVLLDVNTRSKYDYGGDFPTPIQFKPMPDNMIYRFNSALKLGSLCHLLKSLEEEKRSMIFCDDPDGVSVVSKKSSNKDTLLWLFTAKCLVLHKILNCSSFVMLVVNYDLPANCEDYGRRLSNFGPLEQREGDVINFITKEDEREVIEAFEAYYEMIIKERNINNVFKTCR